MAETDVKGRMVEAVRSAIQNSFQSVAWEHGVPQATCEKAVDAVLSLAALSGTREAGEPVRYQRRHPFDDCRWIDIDDSDIEHYRAMGQELRPLYAAPPAEVERGAVMDEMVERGTVEAASLIPNFGRYVDADDVRSIIEAALASPAPQPAVDRFTNVGTALEQDHPEGEWVRFTDHQRALASEKARADRAERERDDSGRAWRSSFDSMHLRAMNAEAAHDATCNVLADTERRRMNAEAELVKLREGLDRAKQTMRNAFGAIETGQVEDKDAHGMLKRGWAEARALLSEKGEA